MSLNLYPEETYQNMKGVIATVVKIFLLLGSAGLSGVEMRASIRALLQGLAGLMGVN